MGRGSTLEAPGFIIGDAMEDARRCPRCHSDEVLPIAYGLPSPEMIEESTAGRVKLGGSVIWPESPDWHCARCGYEWRVEET
jgi:ribosomal protein S27AE